MGSCIMFFILLILTCAKSEPYGNDIPSNRHSPGPVYHGLENQGATCYLNSVLQVLFMTKEVQERLNPKVQTDFELNILFRDLKVRNCKTYTITAAFGIENVDEQRDAAECLQKILLMLSPMPSEVFQGQLRHRTTCSKGHVLAEVDTFWTLQLPMPDASDQIYSVENGFKNLFESTSLAKDNEVYCHKCAGVTQGTIDRDMQKYPKILTLHLKRFDRTMSNYKVESLAAVPRTLQREDVKYELYAMVNHFGSPRDGHYRATIQSSENNIWYVFDDLHVYEAPEQPFEEDKTYKSRSAYLLMYRRETLPEQLPPSSWISWITWPFWALWALLTSIVSWILWALGALLALLVGLVLWLLYLLWGLLKLLAILAFLALIAFMILKAFKAHQERESNNAENRPERDPPRERTENAQPLSQHNVQRRARSKITVVLRGYRDKEIVIDLCNTEEELRKITVQQLKDKIQETLQINLNFGLTFSGIKLKDGSYLTSYGIRNMSYIELTQLLPGGNLAMLRPPVAAWGEPSHASPTSCCLGGT